STIRAASPARSAPGTVPRRLPIAPRCGPSNRTRTAESRSTAQRPERRPRHRSTQKGRPMGRPFLIGSSGPLGASAGSGTEALRPGGFGVADDRLVEDPLGLGGAAPAVQLDPLALLQVLVVLEEVADAL